MSTEVTDNCFVFCVWVETEHLDIDFSFAHVFHRCCANAWFKNEGLIVLDDELVHVNTAAEGDIDHVLSLRAGLDAGELLGVNI